MSVVRKRRESRPGLLRRVRTEKRKGEPDFVEARPFHLEARYTIESHLPSLCVYGIIRLNYPPKSSKAIFSGSTPRSLSILMTASFIMGGPQM